MTNNTDPVRALIAKWRGTHGGVFTSQGEFQAHLSTLRTCADELESALASAPPSASDRMAIRMLVAAGFVTDAKANEALQIAHGFISGPLEPPSAPVGVERKYPDDGNGDDDAYNRGWNDCLDALSQQPAAPSGEAVAEYVRSTVTALERIGEDQAVVAGVDTSALAHKGRSLLAAPQQPAAVDEALREERDALLEACCLAARYLNPDQFPDAVKKIDAAIAAANGGGDG